MSDEIEAPEPPDVVLECDDCAWTYLSDGSIPQRDLDDIMEEHRTLMHGSGE